MLSRTASNLYWMARYVERAGNLARVMEVADRMSLMPSTNLEGPGPGSEWHSALLPQEMKTVISKSMSIFVDSRFNPTYSSIKIIHQVFDLVLKQLVKTPEWFVRT